MSDPIPKDGGTEGADVPKGDEKQALSWFLPPEDFPEELVQRRLARLDTRKTLAGLCKSIPGLDEALLPRGIQADALTRKSGGSAAILKGVSRRILNDAAAWGAFRTAVGEQIPPETFEAVEKLDLADLEEVIAAHTTEGLLLAVLSGETEPEERVVEALTSAWRDENQRAEKQATENAHIAGLEEQLEGLKREHERRARHLERILEGERKAYSSAAERLEELHEELGRVVVERDRIRDALKNARFTDEGFGELLIRAVKNEVDDLPTSLDTTAQTAQLMEFMGSVLRAHADLRETSPAARTSSRSSGSSRRNTEDPAEDPDPSSSRAAGDVTRDAGGVNTLSALSVTGKMAAPDGDLSSEEVVGHDAQTGLVARAKPWPTLSFKALGGAGEVGGSSHILDFGRTRVLVDAGIRPDGRGILAPNFQELEGLDAAVVTHAHLDHCGALPLLVRDQPDVPIYCTPPSARLIAAALNDHAAMGGGLSGGVPLSEVKRRLSPVPFGQPIKVGDTRITLTESGHILGAASVLFETSSATVFHTGDISLEDHFSIPSARLPDVEDIDLLIMEATLADQKPQPFSESVRTMIEVINETTVEREGIVLIPTYALGQAQEIILGLKHYGKEYGLDRNVFIYVDGSVVTTSERLYAEQLGYMKPYLQHTDPRELFFGENIRAVANDD